MARLAATLTRRPRWLAGIACGTLGVAFLFALNWGYQVTRKPSELLALFSVPLSKSPRSTWEHYGGAFRNHSTAVISPEFLAALAQVESRGNPLVGSYWRWKWSLNPFEVYRPASSAVGLYQLTDGAFEEAKKYCIHNHQVAMDGPWHDDDSCWFNALYSRLIPSHAIEMTAARLHHLVVALLEKHGRSRATLEQKHALAAVVHLCGVRRGAAFVRRGFRFLHGERCGVHSPRHYVARLNALKREFARLSVE